MSSSDTYDTFANDVAKPILAFHIENSHVETVLDLEVSMRISNHMPDPCRKVAEKLVASASSQLLIHGSGEELF